jgi:hypothetical protein
LQIALTVVMPITQVVMAHVSLRNLIFKITSDDSYSGALDEYLAMKDVE